MDVYKRLSDHALLKRCLRGKTQNRNESIHNVIWSRCPKTSFASKNKAETACLIGAGEFNMGSAASHHYMTSLGVEVGEDTVKLGIRRDRVRQANSQHALEQKNKSRREKVRLAKQQERRRQQQQEGGPAYVPGGF